MRNVKSLAFCAVAVNSLFAGNFLAAGTTYFYDGFETQSGTGSLTTPPIGDRWINNGTANSFSINSTPSLANSGSNSLETYAQPGTSGASLNLVGEGNAGGFVAGNNLQYIFHVNQLEESGDGTPSNYNAPIQISIGLLGATVAHLGTLNASSTDYYATNGSTAANATDLHVAAPYNTANYDEVRAVLHLTSPSAGMIGGTYDVYIAVDGGTETEVASGFALNTVTIPSSDSTNPAFTLQRGSYSSTSFYDDISIADAPTPEPSAVAAFGLIGSLLLRRRRVG